MILCLNIFQNTFDVNSKPVQTCNLIPEYISLGFESRSIALGCPGRILHISTEKEAGYGTILKLGLLTSFRI